MAKPKTAKLGGLHRIGVPITTRERIAAVMTANSPPQPFFGCLFAMYIVWRNLARITAASYSSTRVIP
jgi:hypothetical protein